MNQKSTDGKRAGSDSHDATPGRPNSTASRQQTQPDQTSQSGSPAVDRDFSEKGANPVPAKPPGAK
jgi:hypothetical protein